MVRKKFGENLALVWKKKFKTDSEIWWRERFSLGLHVGKGCRKLSFYRWNHG